MKEKVWINGDRMLFESGHKTFDRQTNIISIGNIIANTELGFHIRPRSCTECNGHPFSPSHLQRHDLNQFRNLPSLVRSAVHSYSEKEGVYLYEFFHYNTRYIPFAGSITRRVVHGHVITRDNKLLWYLATGPTHKSHSVIMEAIKYVSEE